MAECFFFKLLTRQQVPRFQSDLSLRLRLTYMVENWPALLCYKPGFPMPRGYFFFLSAPDAVLPKIESKVRFGSYALTRLTARVSSPKESTPRPAGFRFCTWPAGLQLLLDDTCAPMADGGSSDWMSRWCCERSAEANAASPALHSFAACQQWLRKYIPSAPWWKRSAGKQAIPPALAIPVRLASRKASSLAQGTPNLGDSQRK